MPSKAKKEVPKKASKPPHLTGTQAVCVAQFGSSAWASNREGMPRFTSAQRTWEGSKGRLQKCGSTVFLKV